MIHVRVPFRRPVETAAGTWTHRDSWIVRERRPDGSVAHGEGSTPEAAVPLDSLPELAGRSVPVNALLGGGPIDEVVARARAAVESGFGTIKMKVGAERSDTELGMRVGAVREAIGPAVKLRLDANGAWEPATAGERIRAVAGYDIEFVEQPIPASAGIGALARLQAASPVRIAADESVVSARAAGELLDAGAADVLVVKPSRLGGWEAARDAIELVRRTAVPVVLSTMFETGAGIWVALRLAATLPEGPAHGLATADLLESDLLKRPLEIVDGRMIVPERIELDESALDRYAVERMGEWR